MKPSPAATRSYIPGSNRIRSVTETLSLIEPLLAVHGISRLADLTRLDALNIWVYAAVRPLAKTLSVSQGKALNKAAAMVGAAMEALELSHAEKLVPDPEVGLQAPRSVGINIEPLRECGGWSPLLSERSLLEWLVVDDLLSGASTLVPYEAVAMDWTPRWWPPRQIHATSNGLASGNCWEEAVLHGLYELVERDVLTRAYSQESEDFYRLEHDRHLPGSVQSVISSVDELNGRIAIYASKTAESVFTATCNIWTPNLHNEVCSGSSSSLSIDAALEGAVLEAGQSRLTRIVGTRDDVVSAPRGRNARGDVRDATFESRPVSVAHFQDQSGTVSFYGPAAELDHLEGSLPQHAQGQTLAFEMSSNPDISVCKVINTHLQSGSLFETERVR